MKDESIALWDAVAEDWARFAERNDFRNLFLVPETMKLLGDVEGKRILDLGCGEGGYARLLAQRGAQVTAVDASRKLIEIAAERARREGLQISHLVRDAARLDGLRDGSYDLVLAAMSLMMDMERYRRTISEIWRVLRAKGILLMSIVHPCFSSRGCRWERDENGNLRHVRVENYFDKAPWKEYIDPKQFRQKVLFHHMPLQDYMKPLLEAGFRLVGFHEPVPTPEQMRQSARIRALGRVPGFLFMRWEKAQTG